MTIIGRIQTEFPGILALIRALKRAWKAYQAYNKAIKAVSTVIITEPITEWGYNVSKHSRLSYEEAQSIYTFITEETELYESMQSSITEFVMEMANHGHTADMIIVYLRRMDRELNK
jgi:hypothetical protein